MNPSIDRLTSSPPPVPPGLPSHPRRETLESHERAVLRVIDAMRQKLSAPLDLAAMAGTAFMSRYHFLRVFETVTAVSPARFLAALRMERAKRLLLETSLPVTAICYEVGYGSLGTFTRLFTEVVGVNPSSFRRMPADLDGRGFDGLISGFLERRPTPGTRAGLTGYVFGPPAFCGFVFVGLFPTSVPQRRPAAGTLIGTGAAHRSGEDGHGAEQDAEHDTRAGGHGVSIGHFQLGVEGTTRPCHLLAAGFRRGSKIESFLLPDQSDLLVGSSVLTPDQAESSSGVILPLRRLRPFDPPVVIALPALLMAEGETRKDQG